MPPSLTLRVTLFAVLLGHFPQRVIDHQQQPPATTVQNSTVARKSDHVIVDRDNLGLNSCHWE